VLEALAETGHRAAHIGTTDVRVDEVPASVAVVLR
jgi:hypothetical protein